MEIPTKNLGTTFSMPAFGIGMWRMRGDETEDSTRRNPVEFEATNTAIETGVQCIYTPGFQNGGLPEILAGKAIKQHRRKDLFIAARVDLEYPRLNDTLNAVLYTVKRLKCKYIDLCLIKVVSERVDLSIAMSALSRLIRKGIVKDVGGINFSEDQITEANFSCDRRLSANLLHYNLLARVHERSGLIDYCRRNGILVIADRPFEDGKLSGPGLAALDALAKKYGKTPAQVALYWLLRQPHVVTYSTITRLEHLPDDMTALECQFTGDDFELLSRELQQS